GDQQDLAPKHERPRQPAGAPANRRNARRAPLRACGDRVVDDDDTALRRVLVLGRDVVGGKRPARLGNRQLRPRAVVLPTLFAPPDFFDDERVEQETPPSRSNQCAFTSFDAIEGPWFPCPPPEGLFALFPE